MRVRPQTWTRTSTDAMQHCSPHLTVRGQRDVKNVKSTRAEAVLGTLSADDSIDTTHSAHSTMSRCGLKRLASIAHV